MAWLVGFLVPLVTFVSLAYYLVQLGRHFDDENDPKSRAFREGRGLWLTSLADESFSKRVSKANEFFFHWFDALFHGKGTLLEQGLWLGLIFSPVMLLLIRLFLLVTGEQMPQVSRMLLLAMTLAFVLSIAVVAGRPLLTLAERVVGVVVVVVYGVVGGVLAGDFSLGITYGLSFATGTILGGVALQLLRFHFPVHPLRSVVLSLVTIFILGAIMRDATVSF